MLHFVSWGSSTYRPVAVAAALVVLLSACTVGAPSSDRSAQPPEASSASSSQSTSAASETTSAPEMSPSSTSPAEPEDSPSEAGDATTADTEGDDTSGDETPKPPVLGKDVSGRLLTTADFFAVPEGWVDGRFNVAGKTALTGVSGELEGCKDEADDETSTVELRLANNFSVLTMTVGQDDDSVSSDSVVTVRATGNGTYREEVKVPFNSTVPFKVDVRGVNALKIQAYKGGTKCDYNKSVHVVMMGMRVQ